MKYTKIKELLFKNGERIAVSDNDIIIIVGPNNAGKSQILKDTYSLLSEEKAGIVIKDILIEKGDKKELVNDIIERSNLVNDNYLGYNYSISSYTLGLESKRLSQSIKKYLVSFLKTEERLSLVNPPEAIDKEDPKTHPIHYILYDKNYQQLLTKYFKKAFGVDVFPRYTSRKKTPLLVGDIPVIENGSAPDIMESLEKKIENCDRVDFQGDGIRSFTGIILNLLLQNYGLYLIDEPESFLHAPQARIIGNVLAEILGENRQAIISTHSEDVIKGLLEIGFKRVKIIRVTRDGNISKTALLDNNKIEELWKDNLLRQSNILGSVFHKNVVICESDSDTRFYSMILEHIKNKSGLSMETLFLFCSGKERLNKVVQSLNTLTVDFRCITDIDVLNNPNTIQSLFESCGGIWDEDIQKKYNIFSASLTNGKDAISKEDYIESIRKELQKIDGDMLRNKDIKDLQKKTLLTNKWDNIKKYGHNAIPAGDGQNAFIELIKIFNSYNLFIVKEGELECFIRSVGGHGPKWVEDVIIKYPDLDDPIYNSVSEFVNSWHL